MKYEKELTKLVMGPLRNIFGEAIPYPVKVAATKWIVDDFAYSYNKVGYLENDRKRLRAPINDKIFISGEHTSTHYGAYWSRIWAARKVVKSLNDTSGNA